ncbi:hypothetical protein M2167_006525 [Streptomyces sp. SPB4]|nr:hypothetical protein [Streptomyces sp. SPB4]
MCATRPAGEPGTNSASPSAGPSPPRTPYDIVHTRPDLRGLPPWIHPIVAATDSPAGVPGGHTDTGPAERGPYRRHGGENCQAVRVLVPLLSVHRAQITNREIAIETSAHRGV